MKISIHPIIFEKNTDVKIGIIHYTKITVDESPQMIKGRFLLFQENLFIELQNTSVTERTGIKEWRQLWKAFGADPNRYRNSSESLMRRIAKQNFLTSIHSAVDLNNLFSLQYEIPLGIYDMSKLKGNIEITLGNESVGYDALNGRYITLNNILYSRDDEGAFGSPYVDSQRAAVSTLTTEALQIFYFPPSFDVEHCQKILTSCGKMFHQIHGGSFEINLLSKEQLSILL